LANLSSNTKFGGQFLSNLLGGIVNAYTKSKVAVGAEVDWDCSDVWPIGGYKALLFINGVLQKETDDYTLDELNKTIHFVNALEENDEVFVIFFAVSTDTLDELKQLFGHIKQTTQTLTDEATIAWDMDLGGFAKVTLGGNRAMGAPTNMESGGHYILIVKQDGTGSRTLSFNSVFKFPGTVAPTLTVTANAVDVLEFVCYDGNLYLKNFSPDVR